MTVQQKPPEKIEESYKRITKSGGYMREEGPTPADIVAMEARKNPWAWGIDASMRLTGYLKLLNRQNAAVTIEQLFFALELTALNWYNADLKTLPTTPERLLAARKAAREYYKKGVEGL